MYQFDNTLFNSPLFNSTPFNSAAFSNAQAQFASATKQFADVAGEINRLALENTEQAFGLQLATFEENIAASFAFLGEVSEVRDFDGFKAVWPKGAQVARENIERSVSTGQEVFGRTVKTNEAIGQLAKGQLEAATTQAKAEVEKATKAATKKARR